MIKRLVFDVSTSVMFVGFAKDDVLVDQSIRIAKRDHAKYLVDRIDQVLKRNKTKLEEVNEIIVGIGPGSYTGLRVAVMVAKMLAWTKNIPLRTVSSLYLMTSGYQEAVAALIDARRGFVYGMVHDQKDILVNEGYYDFKVLQENEQFKHAKTVFIDDRSFLVSLKELLKHTTLCENVHDLVPNYLRKTEAERNYDQKSES